MMRRSAQSSRRFHTLAIAAVAACLTVMTTPLPAMGATVADAGDIEVRIEPESVGVGGVVRAGSWTPIRIELANKGSLDRQVRIAWLLEDVDGDEVQVRVPPVTLGAGDPARSLWLYAAPPINTTEDNLDWRLKVTDHETAELLAIVSIRPQEMASVQERIVGIVGPHTAGLDQYRGTDTQHEPQVLLEHLDPRRLPDRWYGMEALESMLWTSDGGDPRQDGVPGEAIREWVRRGGHLVISFGGAGDLRPDGWREAPALSELWPDVELIESPGRERAPVWLGEGAGDQRIPMRGLRPQPGSDVDVLLTANIDGNEEPVAVTHGFGRGRVTVIGIDLGAEALRDAGLPQGEALWRTVFGWQAPVIPRTEYRRMVDEDRYYRSDEREVIEQGAFIATLVAMQDRVSTPLTVAVLLFLLYGFVAGPLSFSLLRARGRSQLSWPVFLAVVGLFAAVAWGGGMLLRPAEARVSHFSVLTVDMVGGHLHTRSWMSLFLPHHGPVDVEVDPHAPEGRYNVLTSSGILHEASSARFVDPQRYELDARDPGRLTLPMRATAKQLEADYLGHVDDHGQFVQTWGGFEADVRVNTEGKLTGALKHSLPVEISDLVVIYSAGGPEAPVPRVWRLYDPKWSWTADGALDLEEIQASEGAVPLFEQPRRGADDPDARWSGFLGDLVSTRIGADARNGSPLRVQLSPASVTRQIEMLTFYGTLPPPRIMKSDSPYGQRLDVPPTFRRPIGRSLDLSKHLAMRRLIVLGHVRERSPLPMPLTAGGERIERFDSGSRTAIRLIVPVRDVEVAGQAQARGDEQEQQP